MQNKELNYTYSNKIYAALKLIENLYKQGLIDQYIFANILNDYKRCVDISDFRYRIQ